MPTINEAIQLAWKIHQEGNVQQAENLYRQILAQAPSSAATHVYLGIALYDQRQFQSAVQAYHRAIDLQPQFPIAWNNLGNALRMRNELESADAAFQMAIDQDPTYLSPLKNRGTLWVWSGQVQRGLNWYQKGLDLVPDEPELRRNLGVIRLLIGDHVEGWAQYRFRWNMPGLVRPDSAIKYFDAKPWDGSDPTGKHFLLYPEQGLGDEVQFARSAKWIADRGGRVMMVVRPGRESILSNCPGVASTLREAEVFAANGMSSIDYHASTIEVVD
ncbi:MAG: tetratricopeptide repeat protein, partial [Planctomycetota bacterium]